MARKKPDISASVKSRAVRRLNSSRALNQASGKEGVHYAMERIEKLPETLRDETGADYEQNSQRHFGNEMIFALALLVVFLLWARSAVMRACRDWLDDHGFLLMDTPILTPAACEGTTTLFETDYHGTSAYLSQSGQLYTSLHLPTC